MRLFSAFLLSVGLLSCPAADLAPTALSRTSEDVTMEAHFIDVGQGAATLLEFPCGAVLIDTGGADADHVDNLIDYLDSFFARRTDLNRTLKALYVTHPHIDHTRGIRKVIDNFTILKYIDDGLTVGSGGPQVRWVRSVAAQKKIDIVEITNQDFSKKKHIGISNKSVDPLDCPKCDPKVTLLSGGHEDDPGWSKAALENENNHSLVIRVDFGKASFLFGGDLEEDGIGTLLDRYDVGTLLDVDVYHVGHHGSYNATTEDFLKALTPKYAVIPVGKWDDGMSPLEKFNTFSYGHPRRNVLDLLARFTAEPRTPKTVKVADRAKKFSDMTVSKAIYATGWDGTIRVKADLQAKYEITCSRN